MKSLISFKKIMLYAVFSLSQLSLAQYVGVNTITPQKELDINGELKIRTINEDLSLNGDEKIIIVHKPENVIKEIDPSLLQTNTTCLALKKQGSLSILTLGLIDGDNWQTVEFSSSEITAGNASNLTNSTYTVPSTGIYKIGYYFRYGTGIQATLLAAQPKIGILKKTGTISSVLDYRSFLGINLGLANLNLSENSINSIYNLQAGDKIVFAISKPALVDLTLLSSSSSSAYIYKISN